MIMIYKVALLLLLTTAGWMTLAQDMGNPDPQVRHQISAGYQMLLGLFRWTVAGNAIDNKIERILSFGIEDHQEVFRRSELLFLLGHRRKPQLVKKIPQNRMTNPHFHRQNQLIGQHSNFLISHGSTEFAEVRGHRKNL